MLKLMRKYPVIKYVPSTHTLCARWYPTKPRWVPISKGKMWYVHERPRFLPDELQEITRLYNNYRFSYRCCIELIKELHRQNETSQDVIDKEEQEKEELWQEAMKANEEWNRQVAVQREKLDREHLEEEIRLAKEKKAMCDEKKIKDQEMVDALIKEQKELSKTFITPENIVAHIEKILDSPPHSFQYALDLKGNIYDGVSRYPTRTVNEEGQFKEIGSSDEKQKSIAS